MRKETAEQEPLAPEESEQSSLRRVAELGSLESKTFEEAPADDLVFQDDHGRRILATPSTAFQLCRLMGDVRCCRVARTASASAE